MALTTVVRGRAYDWSHAIGRGAATGTGFNYVQTMCLSGDGDLYTANRGNENNFGMRVNRIKLGGPGDEELAAEFFQHGQGDGKATWPFGVAVGQNNEVFCSDEWTNTISVFDKDGKFKRKWGTTGSGDGELLRPAGLAVEKNGNVIVVDSGNNRLQVFTPDGKLVASCGKGGTGDGEFNQPWGITTRQGRQHLRRRLEEPPRAEAFAAGQLPDEDRQLRRVAAAGGCLRGYLPWTVRFKPAGIPLSQGRAAQSPDRRGGGSGRRHLRHRLGQPPGVASSRRTARR